jgi:hypothetical protein
MLNWIEWRGEAHSPLPCGRDFALPARRSEQVQQSSGGLNCKLGGEGPTEAARAVRPIPSTIAASSLPRDSQGTSGADELGLLACGRACAGWTMQQSGRNARPPKVFARACLRQCAQGMASGRHSTLARAGAANHTRSVSTVALATRRENIGYESNSQFGFH